MHRQVQIEVPSCSSLSDKHAGHGWHDTMMYAHDTTCSLLMHLATAPRLHKQHTRHSGVGCDDCPA